MTCFLLPRWVIELIDWIRRHFLWGQNELHKKGISLINWTTVCTPIIWGGMGVSNLAMQNRALLLRWWWRAYTVDDSLWTLIIKGLNRANRPTNPGISLAT